MLLFTEYNSETLDRFYKYATGDNSGTERAHTMALSAAAQVIDRLCAKIEELETRIAQLENPEPDGGSWATYKEHISSGQQ